MPRIPTSPASAIPKGWERTTRKNKTLDLLSIHELLFRHLTPTLCQAVWKEVRDSERERKWSLEAIAHFWAAMIIRHPPSLTHGIHQTRKNGHGRDPLWPHVKAEVNAFFEKCSALRQDFFRFLYEGFTESLLRETPEGYAVWLRPLREHFPQILAVDGSRLDAVCHRLKLLWPVRAALLPGCMTVFYDLYRGITRKVLFYPDAAEAELPRVQGEMDWIARGTLILGDRLYSAPQYFHLLAALGLYGLFRKNGHLKIKRLRVLSRKQGSRSLLEDILVEVGCGVTQPKITLRLIRFRGHGKSLDLLTSVLDPRKLSAAQAVDLYALRWGIERMFLDLKKTLKLHSLYATHPNLVGQQLYASAMVYNAFRVAQTQLASQGEVLPEQISPGKLFPILARALHEWAISQRTMIGVYEANPGKTIKEPNWHRMEFAYIHLGEVLLQRRDPHRRKRRSCEGSKRWKSFKHVPGGPTLLSTVTDG